MAIVMQSMLKQVGIDLEVISLEWGSFVEVSGNGEADIYAIGWTWYPDPEFFMYYMFHSSTAGTYGNGGRYNNPEVDKYYRAWRIFCGSDERITYYRKAEEHGHERIESSSPGYHKLVSNGCQ